MLHKITSRLSEYSSEYPHLISRIPGIIEVVSRDVLIPTSKKASIVIPHNVKKPKMAILKSLLKSTITNRKRIMLLRDFKTLQ